MDADTVQIDKNQNKQCMIPCAWTHIRQQILIRKPLFQSDRVMICAGTVQVKRDGYPYQDPFRES